MKKLLTLLALTSSVSAFSIQTCNLVDMRPLCDGRADMECVQATPDTNMGVCVLRSDLDDGITGQTCDFIAMHPLCSNSKVHKCFAFPNERYGVCLRKK